MVGRRPERALVAEPGASLRIPARRLRAPRMSVVGCGLMVWVVLSGTCRSLRKPFVRRLVAAGQGRVPGCSFGCVPA